MGILFLMKLCCPCSNFKHFFGTPTCSRTGTQLTVFKQGADGLRTRSRWSADKEQMVCGQGADGLRTRSGWSADEPWMSGRWSADERQMVCG
ncbi:hypothetical protein K438DRAFT_1829110 [Mycena galopus ATCC 62051]|nr:hypothetical protein K438DRAFT_1829110 [Mycena galopus ATCC 62051]